MKIVYVFQNISFNFAQPGAPQSHIYHIIKSLQKRGHDVSLLALQGRRVILTKDIEPVWGNRLNEINTIPRGVAASKPYLAIESGVRRVQKAIHAPYFSLFDSHRIYDSILHRLRDCDVLHERSNLLSIGTAAASKKLGIPYVVEVNAEMFAERDFKGSSDSVLRSKYIIWSARFSLTSATKILSVSNQLKEQLIKYWSLPAEKILVLPNAADIGAFSASFDKETIRASLNFTDEPVIVYVGGFYPWHDLMLLLSSFEKVLQRFSSAKLLLVGEGMTKQAVEQKILEKGLENSVVLTGAVPHQKIPEILAIADIAVAPFDSILGKLGGSPIKLFEYMAAGKAIVTTSTGQVAEIIKNKENGILVNAGDVEGFTEAIEFLLENPEIREQISSCAHQQALEKYSWDHYAEVLEETYRSIC